MPLLQSLDEIESVKNTSHRAILGKIRDTSLTLKEIAGELNVNVSTVYYVVKEYLPKGFIRKRTIALRCRTVQNEEEQYSPEDLIHVVPITKTSPSSLSQQKVAASTSKKENPARNSQGEAVTDSNQRTRQNKKEGKSWVTLQWEGDLNSQLESFVCLMKEFQALFGGHAS